MYHFLETEWFPLMPRQKLYLWCLLQQVFQHDTQGFTSFVVATRQELARGHGIGQKTAQSSGKLPGIVLFQWSFVFHLQQ